MALADPAATSLPPHTGPGRLARIGAMSRRTLWLVAYDIRCPRRLADALGVVKAWSTGGQKSVHECWLTVGELASLRRELGAVVAPEEDSVLFLAPDPSRGVRTLGVAARPRDPRFFFVG